MNNIIDLNNLPVPKVVQELSYETLLAQRKAKFLSLQENDDMRQHWQARLQLESEPVVKLLEENAYLELLLRTHINESAKAVMLAYATGSDLDQLGALFGIKRLIIQAEDLNAHPPIPTQYVSTHSHPKVAALCIPHFEIFCFCFNTQPPEGGCSLHKKARKISKLNTVFR